MSAKRYRYTGKERDEETGLYYHGARYYAAWLGRWTSTDPDGLIDGPNMYVYVRNAPVQNLDPNGRETFEHATEPKNAGDILTKGFDPSKGSSGYAWFEPNNWGHRLRPQRRS